MTNGKPMLYQTDIGNPDFTDAVTAVWPLIIYEYSTYFYGKNNMYNSTQGVQMTAARITASKTTEQYRVESSARIYVTLPAIQGSSTRGAAFRHDVSMTGILAALLGMAVLL
jgi:hypothetical protein